MKSLTIDEIIHHTKIQYVKDNSKSIERLKETGEYFTPDKYITSILSEVLTKEDVHKNFIDRMCGDGNWLVEVLIFKVKNGVDFKSALKTIWGSDLMEDNIEMCKNRLLCGQEHLRHIVDNNIRYGNCFDNLFNENESFGNNLFEIG